LGSVLADQILRQLDERVLSGGAVRTQANGVRFAGLLFLVALHAMVEANDHSWPSLDPDSRRWLEELRAGAGVRDTALERLHEILHRVARAEAFRRAGGRPVDAAQDLDHLALEAANDALAAIDRKLESFRGESRFTTWAYKFAVLEVSVRLRRRSWQGRRVELSESSWDRLADRSADAESAAAHRELLAAVRRAVATTLTEHQRQVFTAAVVEEVPIDVLADRLGVARGAVYKTLHDARRKLRASLGESAEGTT
jgi:RNA polymerase sigma-70 factor, ECF subfamily